MIETNEIDKEQLKKEVFDGPNHSDFGDRVKTLGTRGCSKNELGSQDVMPRSLSVLVNVLPTPCTKVSASCLL